MSRETKAIQFLSWPPLGAQDESHSKLFEHLERVDVFHVELHAHIWHGYPPLYDESILFVRHDNQLADLRERDHRNRPLRRQISLGLGRELPLEFTQVTIS